MPCLEHVPLQDLEDLYQGLGLELQHAWDVIEIVA